MQRIIFKLINLLILILTFSSCSTKKTVTSQQESTNPEIIPNSTSLLIRPIMADLEISNERKSIIYVADISLPFNDLRANALKDFMVTYSCDYVVDPQFVRTTTTENGVLKEVEYELSGFPASYTNIYQVDSLPQSLMQLPKVQLPIERVEYTTLNQKSLSGSSLGIEFASGLNFAGFQIDFKPEDLNWHFFLSFDNYFSIDGSEFGNVTFNKVVNQDLFNITAINSTMRSLSVGTFREKAIGERFKIRGAAGLTALDIRFLNSIENNSLQTKYDGVITYGLRVGAALEYSLLPGFSLIGRAHSNIGLFNSIQQSGANTFEIQDITIDNFPFLDVSLGLRFTF